MNKKQKKMLIRIIAAALLLIGFHFLPVLGTGRLLLYLIPYIIKEYDILLHPALLEQNKESLTANRTILRRK